MKFLCPQCKAKYQIADEKVAGRTLRMDCRRCGHNITIRADMAIDDDEAPAKASAPAAAPAKTAATAATAAPRRAGLTGAHAAQPLGAAAGSSLGADFQRSMSKPHALADRGAAEPPRATPLDQWHVAINDVPVGPLRRDEIVKKIGAGAVTADSLCWREGLDDWRPLRDVPELAALLRRSLAPEAPARPGPARAPLAASPRSAAVAPLGRVPAVGSSGGGSSGVGAPGVGTAPRAAARSNVVPIGGRVGGAAAPALDDDALDTGEPTRVGSVDMAELEAKALAAEQEGARKDELERPKPDKTGGLFPDVKRPPTGKITTRDSAVPLAPPPKPPAPRPEGRPESKSGIPLVTPKAKAPAPIIEEPELPIDEPSFAELPAAPAPLPPMSSPLPSAPPPSAPIPSAFAAAPVVAPVSSPPAEERRRGLPVPALIAIAGATAFGGVMAFMIGTRFLGPAPTAPAVATVQPTTAPPAVVAPPPTATVTTPPETAPPATTEPEVAPPPTTTTAPTAPAATHPGGHPRTPDRPTSPPTTSAATGAGAQAATKTPTGRFAEFADDGESGPAHIATSGRTSIADEPGGGGGSSTRGQQELTADQIRAVITRERPAVNRCWESELRRLGQAATVRLDVDLTIGGSGTVTSVTTRGQSVGTLADCIERNVRRWRFPPVSGSTQTSFPLVFSGTE